MGSEMCIRDRLDAWSFVYCDEMGRYLYEISDRRSPHIRGENPYARISLVKEKDKPIQLRIAVFGSFHVEPVRYYTIPPDQWFEHGWLIFPQESLLELRRFLFKFINEETQLWEVLM